MSDMIDGEIIEGFICPMCLRKFSSITQLQAHFEEEHNSEDKAALQSLKGFLHKAKKKFLNDDQEEELTASLKNINPFAPSHVAYQGNSPWEWETRTGACRSHTVFLKKARSHRIDASVAETNKLLIRLNKLLTQSPTDPVKRKAHERSIVQWADDKDVPLCPFCARAFNVARRRHHCRLCGGIMCDECSQFLSLQFAKKLIMPIHQSGSDVLSHLSVETSSALARKGTMSSLISGFSSGMKRSGSHTSLNSILSMVDSVSGEHQLRVCSYCLMRLHDRDHQMEQEKAKPLLSLYYDKLMEYRTELATLLPQYITMAESVNLGESLYNLQEAEEYRLRIFKLGEAISLMAQRIRDLGANGVAVSDPDPPKSLDQVPPGHRQEILQRRIHSSIATFVKDNILGLPRLPSIQEYRHKQEQRRQEIETRLLEEMEQARQAEEKAALFLKKKYKEEESPKSSPSKSDTISSVSFSVLSNPKKKHSEGSFVTGWGADSSAHNVTQTDDPVIQQMNIIRNYIRQAREEGRHDEVPVLERNLKELQEEFKSLMQK